MYKETRTRSVVKTLSWRAVATLTTMILVYIFIGDLTIAISVGSIEVFLKMLVYFLHERAWDKIKFGKKEIKPAVIWLTGLVRSSKSDIAKEVTERLRKKGLKAEHLDGHTIRNLFPETGFEKEEVNEHIKRVGYLAKKLEEQGVFVVASFLSPYKESREFVKDMCGNFLEIYISTPLEICEERDTSGVYKKAREGEIKNLPGVNVEYEKPGNPFMSIDTTNMDTKAAAEVMMKEINRVIN